MAVYAKLCPSDAATNNCIDPDGVCRVDQTPVDYDGRIRTGMLFAPRLQGGCTGTDSDGGPHEINRCWPFFFASTNEPFFQPSPTGQATTIRDRRGMAPEFSCIHALTSYNLCWSRVSFYRART